MVKNRISQLRKRFDKEKIDPDSIGVDALLVSSPVNIQYLTGYPNFSRDEREAYLFVTKKSAILFTDNRYIEAVEQIIPEDITAVVNRPIEIINQMVNNQKLNRVGVENNFTVAEAEQFKKKAKVKIVLTDNLVEKLRAIKDTSEIKSIKKAANLTHSTLTYIMGKIKPGVTEREIAWEMEKFIRQGGGVVAFDTIVAFGPHSSIPHHLSSDYRLQSTDEFILLDFGAKVDGYCADMTRTLLTKSASEKAKKMYDAVLSAQEAAASSLRGTTRRSNLKASSSPLTPTLSLREREKGRGAKSNCARAAEAANEVLQNAGVPPVPHGLGHGIGLEVHELPHLHPKSEDILVPGNYFSIEPGIYIPGFGGIRIEDDYLMTDKGIEQITKSPKSLQLV